MLQSKPLNVEYLMMDASVLLPPTGTPLTGIDFVKRLPCGDVEKTRRVCTHTQTHTLTGAQSTLHLTLESEVGVNLRLLDSWEVRVRVRVLELKYEFPLKAEAN